MTIPEINSANTEPEAPASFPAVPAQTTMPSWYPELLETVSGHVSAGRGRAFATINNELVLTYWAIGRDLLARESAEGWGAKVVARLAADLKERFPDTRGFSPRNLRYMKTFAEAWPDLTMLQTPSATLPWSHHVALLEKLDAPEIRLWYAESAIKEGWSRNVLVRQIESRLHERSGKAVTNFKATLPPSDSDLAQQLTKDPYVFDFVAMTDRRNESELQHQLVEHVQKFLLELGQGFAFVGEQVRLVLGDDEFFADLLFYNFRLRSFVVIELKAGKFNPGYLGQLGMYMAAIDDLLAHPDDKPTIGLLLCKEKNNVVAEYALRGYSAPIGVAQWEAEIVKSLPEEFATSLPSVEQLEAELAKGGPPA
jgi:predicted nuclease of restriction endonuclease-like (RecB) superfamily